MSHITIIRADNKVIVDGRAATVDCASMMNNYHAVQWLGSEGYIETRTGDNIKIANLDSFQSLIDAAQAVFAAEDAPPSLEQQRATALALVDSQAGWARGQFITVIPGQEMTYLEKVRQAQAFQQDPQGNYPLLAGEVGITADDQAAVAAVILGRYATWQVIGAAIEQQRLGAKRDIAAAADSDAIAVVLDGIVWPSA